jgi:SAM-dependent methyltransferase
VSEYGELPVHRWMLRDGVRNEAFRRALAHVVKRGDVVMDLGAGTGILSLFAVAAGARKVYAVERTGIVAVAQRVIAANGAADRIELIQRDAEDVVLPERVDVIVSEWMGGFGVDENILPAVVMCRDRWLKPGGVIVPGRVTALLAPASIPEFDDAIEGWRKRPHGLDLGVIAELTTHETFHTQTRLTPEDLLAPAQVMWTQDPLTCTLEEVDQSFTAKLRFVATRAGAISGLVAWFTAEMGDGDVLTNAVGAPDTHWGRTLFPLERPVQVAAGMPIEIELHCDPSVPGSCEMYWAVKVGDGALEEHDTRAHRRPVRPA